jgi:hypothetical protein
MSYFTGQRKPGVFFSGRPKDLMLCLDSILLMWFKDGHLKGRKAIHTGLVRHWWTDSLPDLKR